MRNDFEQKMGAGILEVIDIGLHIYAIDPVDRLPILFMKRELHVRFTELILFETAGRISVQQEVAGGLGIEFSVLRCQPYLIDQRRVRKAENPVRCKRG